MSKTVNEKVKDEIIGHSIDLNRLEVQMKRDVIKELKSLEEELITQLQKSNILNGKPMTRFKQKRLQVLLKQTKETIQTVYKKAKDSLTDDLIKVAGISEAQTVSALNTSIKAELLSTGLSKQALKSIASQTLIEGAPSKEWWSRRGTAFKDKFSDTVRKGMLAGDTTDSVVRSLRGTRALRYKDGVLNGNYRSAEALVRTSIQTVANEARIETYRDNNDLIKGIEWSATFDSRTSEICASLDGAQWDLDYNPIGGSGEPFPGFIAHWNCRSTTVAIVKSWKELGAKGKFQEIPKSTKASMDGQVSGKKNYEGWLKGKDKKTQEEVLGVGKRKLWKEGKLGFSDLVSGSGKPLTLEQLQSKVGIKTAKGRSPITIEGFIAQNKSAKKLRDIEKGSADLNMGSNGDEVLNKLQESRGFTGLPKVVSEKEFNKTQGYIWEGVDTSQGKGKKSDIFYRGESKLSHKEQFLTGEYRTGSGVFGNGTYGHPQYDYAIGYANFEKANMITMKLAKDAKVADTFDILKEARKIYKLQKETAIVNEGLIAAGKMTVKESENILKHLHSMQDPGRIATMLGYDAIYVDTVGEIIVLNRSKLVVLK